MKLLRWTIVLALTAAVFGGWIVSAAAQAPAPWTPALPSHPPDREATAASAVGPASALSLPPLKAVLIVGPIDGDYGAWTTQEKQNMDLAAAELQANGVAVYKFYAPNNDWNQIKAAASGAHFLFYRGHGVGWSPSPAPNVGGFALKNGFISNDQIRSDLRLAPNAIVMLYGCYTAGSDGADPVVISGAEARRRVAQYSDPFFDLGAAGYFANWYGNAYQMFVRYLFQGQTLGQAYESYFDFNAASVERYAHPDHPDLAMWLDKDDWGGIKYNNAFAGRPGATLAGLFAPAMRLSPVAYASLAQVASGPQSFTVGVDATTSGSFSWTATVEPPASWLSLSPASGASGQTLTVTVAPGNLPLGVYQTSIRIVTHTSGIQQNDQTIPVSLRVASQVRRVFAPAVMKSSP